MPIQPNLERNAMAPLSEATLQPLAKIVADDLMPKRAAFIQWANDRALDTTEDVDAWGQRKFAQPHVESMWFGWFNFPAVTTTGLLELRDLLARAAQAGEAINLSAAAAGALHIAMTTPPMESLEFSPSPALCSLDEAMASGELQQLKVEAKALAAGGTNWSMDVGCMFVLAMIERIEAGADQPPAGYIDRKDLVKLGNCRVTLHAQADKVDPVPLFRAPPAAMLQEFLSIIHDRNLDVGDRLQRIASRISFYCKVPVMEEDPLDIVRTLLCAVDRVVASASPNEPSPIANDSPLMLAARRACVERGFTAGGLAINAEGAV